MGLEIKTGKGKVVFVRETHRVVDPEELLGMPHEPEPSGWGCLVILLALIAVAVLWDFA